MNKDHESTHTAIKAGIIISGLGILLSVYMTLKGYTISPIHIVLPDSIIIGLLLFIRSDEDTVRRLRDFIKELLHV